MMYNHDYKVVKYIFIALSNLPCQQLFTYYERSGDTIFMDSRKKIDMTNGPIMRLVILFALPICLGNVLQQLYSTVDTLVIGNYCSPASLAAVGTSSQPVELLLCVFLGLGTGVSILVSQCSGRGDITQLKKVISTASFFLYVCGIPLSFLGILISPFVLRFMQVPADAWDYAIAYINIIFLGTLGNMGYNMNAGILRGLGDSRASLLFLIISCVVNIVLDIVLVAIFRLDVSGAAIATACAMYSSWLCSILYIRKKYPELEYRLIPGRPDKKVLLDIVKVGLPLGLNNSLYSFGHIMMQSLVNAQGTIFIAGCSVAGKITGIANVAITSFSSAATTFAGQNLGAAKYDRLVLGAKRIPFYSCLITCIAGVTLTFFCEPLLSLFNKDPAVLEIAARYVRVVLPFTWTYAVFNGIISFANGLGEVRYPTIINILMLWAVRIPVGYFINYFIDGGYIMACFPISFAFGMFCMLAFFFTKKWKFIKSKAV